ncbi:DNA methyltransferase [Campylobacter cuniculorum DSM 23162 = LMG 24588]|uniref:Methyltransferase n=2 Tax=Campylobacter cuniculorum TaxID=374106 RepID=A0A1W6BY84_9BACT|nr:DNA methyltransferase [Campylobacter cuniculorum DSM 23162 = LMG 24588]
MNQIFYKSSQNMSEIEKEKIDIIITSPPYFNIKDYAKDGHQDTKHSKTHKQDLGAIGDYKNYIAELLKVWRECERVLKPNGKLCINVPLMPMLKKDLNTHYNRHIFDLQSDIQQSILSHTKLFLLDLYIWNRTNTTKKLMFGSYPYPRNFYAQNTSEFIAIYVKDGKAKDKITQEQKEQSKLTQEEWIKFTKQIWDIPIPNKSDTAFGKHAAIMPEEIVYRLLRLYSFVGDIVLDPFAGSGTTLKVAKELRRKFVAYEVYPHYKDVIEEKLARVPCFKDKSCSIKSTY